MKKYLVTLRANAYQTVEVYAESPNEALDKVYEEVECYCQNEPDEWIEDSNEVEDGATGELLILNGKLKSLLN